MEAIRCTSFEKRRCFVSETESLEWVRVRDSSSRGLLFVSPLIGGSLSQQMRGFRALIREGYDLISFNYSGHGRSSDRFSLGAIVRDTSHMLAHTCLLGRQEHLPLFGIASCYSAIPILSAVHHFEEPLKGLVLINAIPNLSPRAGMKSFLTYYRSKPSNRTGTVRLVAIDYLESLSGIEKSKLYSGALERGRTRPFKTISEFFTLNPLDGVRLKRTPVLCLYACRDRVLQICDAGIGAGYEEVIRRTCSQVFFGSLDGDHLLSLPWARGEALTQIVSFFEACLLGN